MRYLKIITGLIVALNLAGCNNENFSVTATKATNFSFETGDDDWTGGIAGYASNIKLVDTVAFQLLRETLPNGLDTTSYALEVTSINPDTSLFAFIKKQITGLNPKATYNVIFEIDLGTNYPQNIGAGANVFLKAGASPVEPTRDLLTNAFNLDKGNGAADGRQMVSLGNVSNELNRGGYVLVQRNNIQKPVQAVADANGNLWLCIGSDSGYKGITRLYFDRIKVTISQD